MQANNEKKNLAERDSWRVYEREKKAWIAAHPEATSAEYEAAMKLIAEKCGV